ncbi:uncharacterized protein HKW66_Vig0043700 [Vigna angularis]|uniref:C2H2-type domain-containing protein n=1 Tax=Phaseolus angularis TaxID=3914 RepID=A0A8T0L551_PHAAN|nr:uncharacterized protein HKW66_Vig0043700 [Vigna angularis]
MKETTRMDPTQESGTYIDHYEWKNAIPYHKLCCKVEERKQAWPKIKKKNKCAACFRQFNKLEHLVEHMRISYHSVHEPTCGICRKHCRSFESLREHLIGPLPKQECRDIFAYRGCKFCLKVFDSPNSRRIHQEKCQHSGTNAGIIGRFSNLGLRDNLAISGGARGPQVVALACKMVGGGSDGSLDLFQRRIQDFLCNGEPMWTIRARGGRARILVGHGLDHDLECLQIEYRTEKIRYDIQVGIQDPYDDCVATMRLYMRMRSQLHRTQDYPLVSDPQNRNNFASWRQSELERMTPEQMLEISRSDYYCWCFDSLYP